MMNYKHLLDHSLFFNNTILSFSTKNENEYTLNNTFNVMNISNHIAKCNQIHSAEVKYISQSGVYNGIDGLVSNLSNNIYLQIVTADCVPIFMYDEYNGNIGLLHSGWKGTSNKIANNAVKLLISKNSQVQNIKVFCGPSICQKNYEVDWDVASLFSKNNVQKKGHKFLIDIISQIKDDLISIGLESDNIFISDQCTYQDESFRSYRREGEKVGRNIFLMGNIHGSN